MAMNDLRAHFRPEFLNRLDEIIMFKPLTKGNIGGIIGLLVEDVNKRLADRELSIALTDSAKQVHCGEWLRSGLRRKAAEAVSAEARGDAGSQTDSGRRRACRGRDPD